MESFVTPKSNTNKKKMYNFSKKITINGLLSTEIEA